MMKTKNTSGVADFNVASGATRYVVVLPGRKSYVKAWTQYGWNYTICASAKDAFQFDSMTAALLVGFCLGFGDDMETELVQGQPNLPFHR